VRSRLDFGAAGKRGSLRVSGILREIIGFLVFLALALFVFFHSRPNSTHDQRVGFMIVIAAFFFFFTVYNWKFVGF
jgi:hypothetical protein